LFWRLLAAFVVGFALPVLACFGLMVVSALSLQVLALGSSPAPDFTSTRGPATGPAIAVIRVEGLITSDEGGPFAVEGIASAETIVGHIARANADPDVKAILLAVNSPGGGVTASDVIYHALKDVDKPMVVMMGEVAASGGYYVSMASEWIVANPNTLTGSIGVISEFPNAEGLLEKVGVEFVVVTSGPRKDLGSPYREMTEEERAYWQAIVDETYESFVQIVAEGRHMPVDDVRALADGGVYTGRQALEAGLVDQLGYEADAIAKAAELGGITGEPRIIEYQRTPTFLDLLTAVPGQSAAFPSLAEIMTLIGHPTLDARWIGP
jgi:protease-4